MSASHKTDLQLRQQRLLCAEAELFPWPMYNLVFIAKFSMYL